MKFSFAAVIIVGGVCFSFFFFLLGGRSSTFKCPGRPVFFPGTHATPFLLAHPLPRSSASNKQPLINHALLITPAPLSALEIDPLCALLLPDTPGFRPSHLPRHRRLQLVSPLRTGSSFPHSVSSSPSPFIPLPPPCHIPSYPGATF